MCGADIPITVGFWNGDCAAHPQKRLGPKRLSNLEI